MSSALWVVAFPQELFDHIIELAKDDRSTLYNLCLVSRALCVPAQRYLYRRVALGGVRIEGKGHNKWSLNNLVNHAFFTTLVTTQHLALHVREFSFRPDVGDGGASDGTSPWKLFHQALHQMVNLKRLQLTLMTSDQASSRILEALGGHTFQLETFSWMDYRFKMAAHESERFVSFLLSQPNLQALNVLTESLHLVLPERSCPNLSTFVGTFAHALGVLRVRPITNFVCTAPLGSKPRPYMTVFLKTSFSKLRVLILHDYVPVELDYRADLMNCLQSLEALHISLTPNHVYQPGSICILAEATNYLLDLPVLKSLRIVALTGIILDKWQRVMSEHHSFATVNTFVARLFESHPSVERFYTNELHAPNHYQRWNRGEVYPIDVKRGDLENFYQILGFDCSLICGHATYGRDIWV